VSWLVYKDWKFDHVTPVLRDLHVAYCLTDTVQDFRDRFQVLTRFGSTVPGRELRCCPSSTSTVCRHHETVDSTNKELSLMPNTSQSLQQLSEQFANKLQTSILFGSEINFAQNVKLSVSLTLWVAHLRIIYIALVWSFVLSFCLWVGLMKKHARHV